MFELLSAERIKLARHRAAWWLVWIFPIGFTALVIGYTLWTLARGGAPDLGPPETPASWIDDTLMPWMAASSTFGRYLLAGFTAVAFGGEYGWNTWKLVVPHRDRTALMFVKYLMVLSLIATSLVLTAVLTTLGLFVYGLLTDDPAPAGVAFTALVRAHGEAGLSAGLPTVLAVAYAAAGAVLTRSTLAGAIIGVVGVTADALVLQFGQLMHPVLFQIPPGYHLANLQHWIGEGAALSRRFPSGAVVAHGWLASLGCYLASLATLGGVTVAVFRRQDLN